MKTLATFLFTIVLSFGIASDSMAQTVDISAFPDNTIVHQGISSLVAAADANMAVIDSAVASTPVSRHPVPVDLTAEDFITKVYGVLSPDRSRDELCDDCVKLLNLMPSEDQMGLWLDSTDGYQLSYYGQRVPDVSAMAVIERDSVANFGFFFLFPYNMSTKEEMNRRQALFCGSLLQELQDMGAIVGVNPSADALFEVTGDYKGNFVEARLIDESIDAVTGRYVLYLSVEPGGNVVIPGDKEIAQTAEPTI